jgi:glutathione S-transferase
MSEAKKNFPLEKPSLVYWELCGRGDIAKCLFYAGDIEYDLDTDNANSWPAYKGQCPFGQIPVLNHGDLNLAQGGAINRYIARLGGIYPEDPVAASKCDMIMEECMEIFTGLFKVRRVHQLTRLFHP